MALEDVLEEMKQAEILDEGNVPDDHELAQRKDNLSHRAARGCCASPATAG